MSRGHIWLMAGLLLAGFWLTLHTLETESLWLDEAYSAWAVRDAAAVPPAPAQTLTDTLITEARQTLRSLRDTFVNVRDDVHPPLYYLLLDGWARLFGDSEFMLRLPSVLMGLVALSATYAPGATYLDRRTGFMALLLTGSAGFFLYYTQEARMYALYLALITLSYLVYVRWQRQPSVRHGLLYALLMLLALYTHYVSALFLLVQGLHLLLMTLWRRDWQWRYLLPFALTVTGYLPWLPFALRQWNLHPAGAAALPVHSEAGALWLILTNGYPLLYLLPFALLILSRDARTRLRQAATLQALSFCLLWLIVPPLLLLALNAGGRTLFQLRYLLPLLPAWALLLAVALRHLTLPLPRYRREISAAVSVFLCGWLIYTQLATHQTYWPEKPRWREAVADTAATRQPLEGALTMIQPRHPTGYYAPRYGLTAGYSIAVGWRDTSAARIAEYAAAFADMRSVWVMAPAQAPQTWDSVYALQNQGRGVGYRDSVQGTIFYRLDSDSSEPLQFAFHDASGAVWRYLSHETGASGAEYCVRVRLQAGQIASGTHQAELHLTRGYNEVIAQRRAALNATESGQVLTPRLCLDAPAQAADYHLRLMVTDDANNRLLLLEDNRLWGDYLLLDARSEASHNN
jgi:4-amino-4-deoxy-L-arabinose transferase-like glycosyltransferase